LTYLLDQLSKVWALRVLTDKSVDLIGGWLKLKLSHNPGAALSMGTSITWVFAVLALGVSVGIVMMARRLVSRSWALTLGLLLGGALGNLTDRIVRPPGPGRGAVVDFISYGSWFIGNLADVAIVVAMVLMMIGALRGVPLTAEPTAAGSGLASGQDAEGVLVVEPAGLGAMPGEAVETEPAAPDGVMPAPVEAEPEAEMVTATLMAPDNAASAEARDNAMADLSQGGQGQE